MPSREVQQRPSNYLCGMANWHPSWMQKYATTKMFMGIYGLLGTIQAMSYMYFIVTLTTIEKRFKIPSQTTGIILSGNEISQILLSLILSYMGGQRNRPRWIAWGIVFCGLSCYIIALPHFIYGAGNDVLHLTQEYVSETNGATANLTSDSMSLASESVKQKHHLCGSTKFEDECDALLSIMPLILIFLSQFVLGIGNTLYYSLGQTYLDDNTKKTNTPLMLAVAMALRMIGPIVGFFLGYVSLNMFIDPSKTPLIDNKDPRWLGAWWFGWMILGTLMVLFSGLIGLFPKQLPKKRSNLYNSHTPHVLRNEELQLREGLPLGSAFSSTTALDAIPPSGDYPTLKNFPKALMRLLRNKLLIYNIISAIFYIIGAAGYMTFFSRYMEVQFQKSSQNATIIVGPVSILGMVIGLIGSGLVISKKKPSPSKVLMWNVIVGCVYICGQVSYMFLYCGDSSSMLVNGKLNVTTECNSNCSCDGVPYSPVCHVPSDVTYFSACHAGCRSWDSEQKIFSNCSCAATSSAALYLPSTTTTTTTSTFDLYADQPSKLERLLNPVDVLPTITSTTLRSTIVPDPDIGVTSGLENDFTTVKASPIGDLISRSRRSLEALGEILQPGPCVTGCNTAFWTFSILSTVVNWFGSSGRIGNLLVNYRAVSNNDKSFAQGLSLMMISLFALIPGPIIFGRIIDSTCLVWTETCNGRGNCQLYDQTSFRYLVNITAFSFTAIGVVFDVLVWYYGRNLDLYGDKDAHRSEEAHKNKNQPLTPLLNKK